MIWCIQGPPMMPHNVCATHFPLNGKHHGVVRQRQEFRHRVGRAGHQQLARNPNLSACSKDLIKTRAVNNCSVRQVTIMVLQKLSLAVLSRLLHAAGAAFPVGCCMRSTFLPHQRYDFGKTKHQDQHNSMNQSINQRYSDEITPSTQAQPPPPPPPPARAHAFHLTRAHACACVMSGGGAPVLRRNCCSLC